MRRVNLIPVEMVRRDWLSGRVLNVRLLTIAGVSILLLWCAIALNQIAQVKAEFNAASRILVPLRKQADELSGMEAEHTRLSNKIEEIERLRGPVSVPAIITALTQMIPEDAVLSSLTVESKTQAADSASERDNGRPQRKQAQVAIEGNAKSDVAITSMVTQIGQSEMFSNVRLADSREINHGPQSHYSFRLTMSLSTRAATTQQMHP